MGDHSLCLFLILVLVPPLTKERYPHPLHDLPHCLLMELTFGNSKVKVRKQHQSQARMLHKMELVVGMQMGWWHVDRDCGGIKGRRVAVRCSPPWGSSYSSLRHGAPSPPGLDAGEQPAQGWVDGRASADLRDSVVVTLPGGGERQVS